MSEILLEALKSQIEATKQCIDNIHNCPEVIDTAQWITESNELIIKMVHAQAQQPADDLAWLKDAVVILDEGAEPMVGDVVEEKDKVRTIQRNGKPVVYRPKKEQPAEPAPVCVDDIAKAIKQDLMLIRMLF